MEEWKKDRIGACLRGENPMVLARMKSGFAVMADTQFLPGYCVLLHYPQVGSLAELSLEDRRQYLLDTTLIGDAIEQVLHPRRVNYSTLMNQDGYLHTHIEARYEWEPELYKFRPSWIYPESVRNDPNHAFDPEKHGKLQKQLAQALTELMQQPGYENGR